MTDLLLPYKMMSITMDNGSEFSRHEKLVKKLDIETFFADPYCSWQKGQIENTNKLIRQYYPKSEEINEFNTKNINEIPRKKLGFKTPFEFLVNL